MGRKESNKSELESLISFYKLFSFEDTSANHGLVSDLWLRPFFIIACDFKQCCILTSVDSDEPV